MLTFSAGAAVKSVGQGESQQRLPMIACPECGAPTVAREDSVLCSSCVRSLHDWRRPLQAHISRSPKLLSFTRCPSCLRVCTSKDESSKSSVWIEAEHESHELLGWLLRKLLGSLLGKRALSSIEGMSARVLAGGELSLTDARFVWTEPHSRRVKLELVVTHVPGAGSGRPRTEHKCEVELVEERRRCESCLGETSKKKSGGSKKMGSGGGDFGSKVQIRASGGPGGERTIRSLSEALRSTSAVETATSARTVPRGIDVEFDSQSDAAKFIAELRRLGRAPLKFGETSRKLVTHDEHTGVAEFQRTTLVTVPPIDKHDLVLLDGLNDWHLVLAVRHSLKLLRISKHGGSAADAATRDVSAERFFRKPFEPLASATDMVKFDIIDQHLAVRADHNDDDDDDHHRKQPPRRFFAPFDCKLDRAYMGYDLDTFAHRVHVPASLPRIVLVVPAAGESRLGPPGPGGAPVLAAQVASATPQPDDDDDDDDDTEPAPPKIRSRKERRKLAKQQHLLEQQQRKEKRAAASDSRASTNRDRDDEAPTDDDQLEGAAEDYSAAVSVSGFPGLEEEEDDDDDGDSGSLQGAEVPRGHGDPAGSGHDGVRKS